MFGSGFSYITYTQFCGNYLFHSVTYYQNTFNIMDGRFGMNLSHGCVRLQIDNAKWIYDNIPSGTKVVHSKHFAISVKRFERPCFLSIQGGFKLAQASCQLLQPMAQTRHLFNNSITHNGVR